MLQKRQLLQNIFSLLFCLLILSNCGQKTNIVLPITITNTVAPSISYTQLVNTAVTLPTETATVTPVTLPHLQITYSTTLNDIDNVYAISVECPEITPPCLREPILLFEFHSTIYNLNWSPDGQRVVFDATGVGGKSDIFIADWSGDNLINLTHSPDPEASPIWTPDGKRIGYVGCVSGRCDFISANPDGSDPVRLLDQLRGIVLTADWSPNADQILFNGAINEPYNQIYLSNIDGSDLTKLTQDYTEHYSQVFSPDGKWIAFIRINDPEQINSSDVFLIRPDGSNDTNLTKGLTTFQGLIAWSPQGNWLAFSGKTDNISDIYLIHPDGTGVIRVTQGIGDNGTPAWRLFSAP